MPDTPDTTVSPILEALYRGDSNEVDALLADQPELDAFEAAAVGRTERLRELLDANPELAQAWSSDGFTPLHLAAFFGQADAVELLLERGAGVEVVSKHEFVKVTPLHSAVAAEGAEDARTVQTLLEHGAPPNARAEGGATPLHSAAANGDRAIVELLLAHGADPSVRRDDGKTPAELAREAGQRELAEVLG